MKDEHWIEAMEDLGAIRRFCSLYLRKSRKGALASAQEVDMLFRVALSKKPLTPLELSRQMGVSKTIISRLIEGFLHKHLIEKVFNQEDKRSCFLRITERGKEELDSMYNYYLEPLYGLQENLGEESFRELLKLIRKANEAKEDFF